MSILFLCSISISGMNYYDEAGTVGNMPEIPPHNFAEGASSLPALNSSSSQGSKIKSFIRALKKNLSEAKIPSVIPYQNNFLGLALLGFASVGAEALGEASPEAISGLCKCTLRPWARMTAALVNPIAQVHGCAAFLYGVACMAGAVSFLCRVTVDKKSSQFIKTFGNTANAIGSSFREALGYFITISDTCWGNIKNAGGVFLIAFPLAKVAVYYSDIATSDQEITRAAFNPLGAFK